jgi:hypothetical protein
MSNKEEETKTTPDQLNQDSQENKESQSKFSPYRLADRDVVSNGGMGCIGGFIYIILVPYLLSELSRSFSNIWVLAFFEVLGPVLVFLFGKKLKNKALFWGFLIPYFLVLLLFGTCKI